MLRRVLVASSVLSGLAAVVPGLFRFDGDVTGVGFGRKTYQADFTNRDGAVTPEEHSAHTVEQTGGP